MSPRSTTSIPHVAILADGCELDREDALALHEVRVRDRLSLPCLCELRFLGARGALGRGEGPGPGAELTLRVADETEPLFTGDITALEHVHGPSGEHEIRLRAYDRLHRLRKRQPVRTHVEVTCADLAADLVGPDGLSVARGTSAGAALASLITGGVAGTMTGLGTGTVGGTGDTSSDPGPGPLWPRLVQFRQTDFDLLAETAERAGLYFTLRGTELRLLTLEGFGEPRELRLGDNLFEARFTLNSDPACRSVVSTGWDPWTVQPREGAAQEARVAQQSSGGTSSPQEHLDASREWAPGEWRLVDEALQTEEQADAMAQAELDHRTAREVVLQGVADGDPHLHPGIPVEIRGVVPPFEGRHVLTEVNHVIDTTRGYVSEILTEPPRLEHRPWGTIMTFGVVTRVDDPEGLGRVQVQFPAYGDLESDWIGVVIPGAGPQKGLIALPDVEDTVLVLLAREDPAQAVVVGGLFGSTAPPDDGLEGSERRRFALLTPRGQTVRLDDERRSLRIDNGAGSSLELRPGKVSLRSAADIEITAPGKNVVISGAAIDFRKA